MFGCGFINYDCRQYKVLSLQDMLVFGQEEVFWKQVELVYKVWLLVNKFDQDVDFQKIWLFQCILYVVLIFGVVMLKYDVYFIVLYFYVYFELKILYLCLNGIVKLNLFFGCG